ncbi:hypothetical protein BGZ88_006259 [Linnemannia elongata]|nr:hypothetical protein BGZ88_006259 [Linnemannia elongata]
MHFSTIFVASAMVILSAISAQSVPSAPNMLACSTCMDDAAIAAVPTCKGLKKSEAFADSASSSIDKQKACYCGLKSNKTWTDSCVGPEKCPAEMKDLLVRIIVTVTAQPGICDNVSATNAAAAGDQFCESLSTKVAAVGAVALAAAGAFL